jgi:Ca2+-transporting ATPase
LTQAAPKFNINGLTNEQVLEARARYGHNKVIYKKQSAFWEAVGKFAKDPMVILLLVASSVYFLAGDTGDGIFLASAIILVSAISLFQDSRSRNALEKLKSFTEPACQVIREGKVVEIKSEELVVGDCLMVEEGTAITADAIILQANDFSVNESILTGESVAVAKDEEKEDKLIFQGTTVVTGLAIARVTAIGAETRWGKIGKSLEDIQEEKTPLELQINNFVKKMAIAGAVVFLIVWGINFFHSHNLLDSLLKALTLAMSVLPEEIPVAFTTFMALGAWRMMKMGIVAKQMKTVETLGSATIICTDKTGTITENKMTLAKIFALASHHISDPGKPLNEEEKNLVTLAMWASEPIPFDPMEIALHDFYPQVAGKDERPDFKMVHEYPLSGRPPMMTHVFANGSNTRIIAAKGAPEALMAVSQLSAADKASIEDAIQEMAKEGYRVLGVGEAHFTGEQFPERQQMLPFVFKGIVAFYDPPKKNIQSVLESFYKAGISVRIITGDNAETTSAIARQVGFVGYEKSMTGDALMKLPDNELQEKVRHTYMFTRMFPDAKLRIINALKANHEIVAMTGDGVNDGPALKAAHIGIAMGKKGTEIARQAASLILLEDDLSKIVDAVAMGRKIYANLKKAIQFVISIHIPIILTVFMPLALGWMYPNIFSPVHIIFLELIMGPTCSIVYEHEPMEKNAMLLKPRPFTTTFFVWRELMTSVIQGLAITAGTLGIYQYAVIHGFSESHTRAMVFTVLVMGNVFLTLVNRSFYYSVFTTLKYKNNLMFPIIMITLLLAGLMIYIAPLGRFFQFDPVPCPELFLCIFVSFVSVFWYELVKWHSRRKEH